MSSPDLAAGTQPVTGRRKALLAWMVMLAAVVGVASAAGIPVRATYGAQTTSDEPQYLLSAMSIVEDGSLDISDELTAQRWRAFHEVDLPEQTRPLDGGRRVSPHDPLLPVLLAPALHLGGWIGAKAFLSAVAGLLAAVTLWVATVRFGVPVRVAALVVAVFSLSAPLAVYGTQIYPEVPAALAVTLAVGALTGPLGRRGVLLLGACVIALPWLAVKYAPVGAALAALGGVRLWRGQRRSTAAGLFLALLAAGAVFVVVHQLVWTGWTSYASADHFVDSGEFGAIGFRPNLAGRALRLIGLLAGQRFGLAAWQPAWLLLLPALGALVRRRPGGWTTLVLPLMAGWLNATFAALTMRGWWFPGRQVVVVLPVAVIAVAWWAGQQRRARAAVAALGLLGVTFYGWLVVDGWNHRVTWVVDFFQTGNPLYRLWRHALPDYLDPGLDVVLLHVAWSGIAVALMAAGWHWGDRATDGRAGLEQAADRRRAPPR